MVKALSLRNFRLDRPGFIEGMTEGSQLLEVNYMWRPDASTAPAASLSMTWGRGHAID
jgi:hypothetical protein